jgi:hypothetical protein
MFILPLRLRKPPIQAIQAYNTVRCLSDVDIRDRLYRRSNITHEPVIFGSDSASSHLHIYLTFDPATTTRISEARSKYQPRPGPLEGIKLFTEIPGRHAQYLQLALDRLALEHECFYLATGLPFIKPLTLIRLSKTRPYKSIALPLLPIYGLPKFELIYSEIHQILRKCREGERYPQHEKEWLNYAELDIKDSLLLHTLRGRDRGAELGAILDEVIEANPEGFGRVRATGLRLQVHTKDALNENFPFMDANKPRFLLYVMWKIRIFSNKLTRE